MISVVKHRASAIVLSCVLLGGCSGVESGDADVKPAAGSGSVEVRLDPPTAERFVGTPTRIGFEPVRLEGGEFTALADFAFLPDGTEFLAVNRSVTVARYRLHAGYATMIGSFQIPAAYTDGDCSASIAIDPDFATNRLFYVAYCIDDGQFSAIKRFTMSNGDFSETLFTAANMLAAGDSKADFSRHPITAITFGPDGVMWASVGDRGNPDNAQDTTNELGKVIRLRPLKDSNLSGHTPASDNMSPKRPPESPLVYAYGLGDPGKGAFDADGRFWLPDNASPDVKEINIVSRAGQNFGWPDSEGRRCLDGDCTRFVPPSLSWDGSDSHRYKLEDPLVKSNSRFRSAWVGLEYRPTKIDRYGGLLTGKMLYGDLYLGYVRGATVDSQGVVISDQHLGNITLPMAWRQGRDGYVYVGTMYASAVSQVEDGSTGDGVEKQGGLWRVVPLP